MALFLLLIFIIVEIGFAVYGFTLAKDPESSSKKKWTLKRLIVSGAELAVYLLMMLLPGIDFSFRFKGLAIMLVLRIVLAGIFALINRKNDKPKKKVFMILSAICGIFFLGTSMIPAFVITDYNGRALTGEYEVSQCEAIFVDEGRVETFENDGSCREVPVHFYYPANVADLPADSLPLVLFSHGAFGYYQSNSSTYMELASNGYVVVSMDHPYHSFFTKDTRGKTITVDPGFFQTALTVGNAEMDEMSEAEVYEVTSKWMELREADMNFVLDELEKADGAEELPENWHFDAKQKNTILSVLDAINYDKIGLMGHSLGGATAVTVGRRDDVSAVIDLDGTMLGEETGVKDGVLTLNEEPYDTPLLSIVSEVHHEEEAEAEQIGYLYVNTYVMEHATDGYETYFKDTDHMNFTDLPLFSPVLAAKLGIGEVDAGECIDGVNARVLGFFNCYLKGEGEFSVEECY